MLDLSLRRILPWWWRHKRCHVNRSHWPFVLVVGVLLLIACGEAAATPLSTPTATPTPNADASSHTDFDTYSYSYPNAYFHTHTGALDRRGRSWSRPGSRWKM